MRKTILLFSVINFLFIPFLVAQQIKDSLSVDLSEVQVNASRNKLYSEMGRVLTVIDKTEMKQSAVQSIDQLLDYVSGIDIRQRGIDGTQADISLRGGSFDQVLVLLNGVNITDPQTGHFNLDIPLNLSDVSRVEILQGSSARVLGPNAFSGAINIVTENTEKRALNAELTAGSFNTFGESVSGSLGNNLWQNFASVMHKSSSGYRPNTDFAISSAFIQSVLKTKNTGQFDLQLAGQLKEFGANGFYSLAYPNQFESSKTFLTSLNWTMSKGKFTYNGQAYWRQHHDKFELFRDNTTWASWYTGHNYHLTDITGGKAIVSYLEKQSKTTIGVDFRNEHIYSNVLGNIMSKQVAVPFENGKFFTREDNRLLGTGFIDQTLIFKKWYFSIGVASTYSSSFGIYSYGGLDVAYELNENIRVFADANSAFRLPTFTDLYYKSATQIANPSLKPEKSQTLEIGTKIKKHNWKMNASTFKRFGQNVIDWTKEPDSTKWFSRNLTSVNAFGVDLNTEYQFNSSFLRKISVSYSYLLLDKSATGFDSKYALDYLKNKITLQLQHAIWKNLSASWAGSWSDRAGQYTDFTTGNLTNYLPYFLLDGRISWSQRQFDIFADANNILNTNYADFGGLIQPGFRFDIGFRLKLK